MHEERNLKQIHLAEVLPEKFNEKITQSSWNLEFGNCLRTITVETSQTLPYDCGLRWVRESQDSGSVVFTLF